MFYVEIQDGHQNVKRTIFLEKKEQMPLYKPFGPIIKASYCFSENEFLHFTQKCNGGPKWRDSEFFLKVYT